jgi:hypothetical protein
MDRGAATALPLHITLALEAAESGCAGDARTECHDAALRLADALTYYLGAVAVAQYSQALYLEQISPDPTLNRSLRSLKRVLTGQWLGWAARGLESTPGGPVAGMREWYAEPQGGDIANAYEALLRVMVEQLGYTGEYGPRQEVSPRILLEMIDQYRIRREKAVASSEDEATGRDGGAEVGGTDLLAGLRAAIESAGFLSEYPLYAPQQRQLLMGPKPTAPMPPMSAPGDAEATILLYPPGEPPDYTKRPNLQAERVPLFPLDPLLVYIHCAECDRPVVAALREVVAGTPTYIGLDPRCNHAITV